MTDREKLIELLVDVPVNYELCMRIMGHCPTIETPCYECLADYLLANGVTFATDTNVGSKWTRVKDRLPETHLRCLVYREGYNKVGGYMSIATFTPCYNGLEGDLMNGRQVWFEYDSEVGDYELTNVTHWMPLPVPPEVELYRPKKGGANVND
ncbi:MAG: DUF551 domain-containing protein [Bacteroidaceae bacterium]|nr:DUF551 domain-containing protein [Bacteroidaceae bacterium]